MRTIFMIMLLALLLPACSGDNGYDPMKRFGANVLGTLGQCSARGKQLIYEKFTKNDQINEEIKIQMAGLNVYRRKMAVEKAKSYNMMSLAAKEKAIQTMGFLPPELCVPLVESLISGVSIDQLMSDPEIAKECSFAVAGMTIKMIATAACSKL